MIKVNLLKNYSSTISNEVAREQEESNAIAIDFFKRLVIFIIAPVSLYLYENYNINELTNKKNSIQTEVSQLQEFNQKKEPTALEIKKYEEDKSKLNKQTAFLQRVSKDRLFEPDLIQELKQVIPDGVWLNQLSVSNSRVEISGFGDNDKAISQFESNLIGVKTLKGVRLEDVSVETNPNVTNEKLKNIVIRSFLIKAQLNTEDLAIEGVSQ